MIKATIDDHLDGALDDEAAMIAAFEKHSATVKAAFGPDRLLVFQARDGWAPLCSFLGLPVPKDPYPHINSKEEFDSVVRLLQTPVGVAARNGDGFESGTAHADLFDAP